MPDRTLDDTIQALRRFTRFVTQRLGTLESGPAGSSYSATEVRVLGELARHEPRTVASLSRSLGLDIGYLSRILRRLETTGAVLRPPVAGDSRQQPFGLTGEGHAEVRAIEAITTARYAALVRTLADDTHTPLLELMEKLETLLGPDVPESPAARGGGAPRVSRGRSS